MLLVALLNVITKKLIRLLFTSIKEGWFDLLNGFDLVCSCILYHTVLMSVMMFAELKNMCMLMCSEEPWMSVMFLVGFSGTHFLM